tara:strand:+ start:135 stop:800 length:666 start_codon:yes stop_codon:yes gene_type:complete
MNIALIFAGISFGHKSDRDFNHCFPNIDCNLIQPLKEEHSVYNYIVTYENERIDEVTKLLNPKKLVSIPFENSRQNPTRTVAVRLPGDDDIDFYIMSRFDVHYNKKLSEFNLDWNKFNFSSREGNGFWESQQFVGDTFYAWPKRVHNQVLQGFDDLAKFDPNHMHNFYSILAPIIGQENIHFMSEEHQLSGHLLTNVCTRDYTDRLRGKIPINEEIIARFP